MLMETMIIDLKFGRLFLLQQINKEINQRMVPMTVRVNLSQRGWKIYSKAHLPMKHAV